MLSESRSTAKGTFEEAQQKAKQLGVKVTLDGYIPPDTTAEQLITAAVRECVTNCIRHAGGRQSQCQDHREGRFTASTDY